MQWWSRGQRLRFVDFTLSACGGANPVELAHVPGQQGQRNKTKLLSTIRAHQKAPTELFLLLFLLFPVGFGGGTGGGPRRGGCCSVVEGGGCAVLALTLALAAAVSPLEPLSWSVSRQPGGGPIMTSGSGVDAASLAYFSRSDRSPPNPIAKVSKIPPLSFRESKSK